jgi:hypothetical protein
MRPYGSATYMCPHSTTVHTHTYTCLQLLPLAADTAGTAAPTTAAQVVADAELQVSLS